jgi:hypothetical protein
MMKRRTFILSGAALVSAMAAETDAAKLVVQVSYSGSGTVDGSHKVYVVLWDNAGFTKGATSEPIAVAGVASKAGAAEFEGLDKNPVFVSMVYDPTGKWDAMSPPPPGSSLGMYSKDPGTPAPVELKPGKTTTIRAAFDDSQKMP